MKREDVLYVGGAWSLRAYLVESGDKLWEREFSPGWLKVGLSFVSVTQNARGLFAVCAGVLYRLEPFSGEILWQTKLDATKSHLFSLMLGGTGCAEVIVGQWQQDAAETGRDRVQP